MLAKWVPAHLTPSSFDEAAVAMRAALRLQIGHEPSRECLALALAKTALETGRWRSIWCNNWGNVKAGETYAGLYCTIELNEVLDGKVVWFSPRGRLERRGGNVVAEPFEDPPGHPQTRMRAYPTREDGAIAYVAFVAGGRYASAWQRLLAGDAAGYVTELRAKGYFTAPLADYLKGVVSLQKEFLGKLNGQHPEPASVPPPPITLPPSAAIDAVADMRAAANRALELSDPVGLPGSNLRQFEHGEPEDPESNS